jgi:hypothetical protein
MEYRRCLAAEQGGEGCHGCDQRRHRHNRASTVSLTKIQATTRIKNSWLISVSPLRPCVQAGGVDKCLRAERVVPPQCPQ